MTTRTATKYRAPARETPAPPAHPDLYYYTCQHGAMRAKREKTARPLARIATPGEIALLTKSHKAERFASQLIWLTSDPDVDLTESERRQFEQHNPLCPQVHWRFLVEARQSVFPWETVRQEWPVTSVAYLESRAIVDPATWWVSGGCLVVHPAFKHNSRQAP